MSRIGGPDIMGNSEFSLNTADVLLQRTSAPGASGLTVVAQRPSSLL